MSHIVVYQSSDGSSGFEPCSSLDAAIVAAERMRNVDGVDTPRIFRMQEVRFDFRPYFRVEVSGEVEADLSSLSAGAVSSLASAPVGSEPVATEPVADTMPLFDAHFDVPTDDVDESPAVDAPTPIEAVEDDATEPVDDWPTVTFPNAAKADPLEHSVSTTASLRSVESLDRLQESVEAFATSTDLPPPSSRAELTDVAEPADDVAEHAAIADTVAEVAEIPVAAPESAESSEPETAGDPLVSVRRGLFGR